MTKTLYILRHAEAEPGGPEIDDFTRRLTVGGEAAAEAAGRNLATSTPHPTVVLASPAARTKRTAELVAALSASGAPVQFERSLYLASAERVIELIRGFDEEPALLVVGHNPGLEEVASRLVHRSVVFAPAACLTVELDLSTWSQIDLDQPGRFVSLWTPGI